MKQIEIMGILRTYSILLLPNQRIRIFMILWFEELVWKFPFIFACQIFFGWVSPPPLHFKKRCYAPELLPVEDVSCMKFSQLNMFISNQLFPIWLCFRIFMLNEAVIDAWIPFVSSRGLYRLLRKIILM